MKHTDSCDKCKAERESARIAFDNLHKACVDLTEKVIPNLRDDLIAAVAAERERCAKLCEELQSIYVRQGVASPYGDQFAAAIRQK